MLVAEYLIKRIELFDVKTIFGYQGSNITYVIDEIAKSKIRFVETRHEQAAAFAANAYAQSEDNFGVAVSSSGPGAINMLNGIANAYYDSIPCLFITGNVNSKALNHADNIRQNSFQESNIVSMAKCITKFSYTVLDPNELPQVLEDALLAMYNGRPGPVLLDIPHDIQRSTVLQNVCIDNKINKLSLGDRAKLVDVDLIVRLLKQAEQPLILVGGGMRDKKAQYLLSKILKSFQIPVVCSLCGLDKVDNSYTQNLGMIGSYGNPIANLAFYNTDLLLVLGSRLTDRQVITNEVPFAPNAKIVHVDIDKDELVRLNRNKVNICIDILDFLKILCSEINLEETIIYQKWRDKISEWKRIYNNEIINKDSPDYFLDILSDMIEENSAICVDVGEHQMFVAQSLRLKKGCRLLNSAGLGSMGYSLPASIGAYYSWKYSRVFSLVGDGGLQMNLQELETISENEIPIVIIVFNNNSLGMIKSYQEKVFNKRYIGSVIGYSVPDIASIAKAFEIEYMQVSYEKNNYEDIEKYLLKNTPVIIEYEYNSEIGHRYGPSENYNLLMQNLKFINI